MSKAFTKKVFDWLRQVRRDKRVHKFDVCIALELTDYFNEDAKDGRAWPSYRTIGDAIHVPEKSVRRAIERLVAHGHLYVVSGRQGRGHSNQYIMKLKPVEGTGFSPEKPVEGTSFKNRSRTPENRSQGPQNHLNNQEDGGYAPAPAREARAKQPPESQDGATPDQESASAASSINEATVAPAFAAFAQAYPKKTGMSAAQSTFIDACAGADPDYIVARAKLYAKDHEGERARYAIPPKQWLQEKCFNDPLPEGGIIDYDTGEFLVQTNKSKPKSKREMTEEFIRKYGNASVH
jgi:hypothetical protein